MCPLLRPLSCLLLVVAAPAAPTALQAGLAEAREVAVVAGESPVVKRSARVLSYTDIPATGFSCQHQEFPGLYADQETGCQVFHYCQPGGRRHSFFCPNLTLFNQQYFVCDWEYNVDCAAASQYFGLNKQVFAALPAAPDLAILPNIKTDLVGAASSAELSRSLSTLAAGLGGRTAALPIDRSLDHNLAGAGGAVGLGVGHAVDHAASAGPSGAAHAVVHAARQQGVTSPSGSPAVALGAGHLAPGEGLGGAVARQGKAATIGLGPVITIAAAPAPTLPGPQDTYDDAVADPEPAPGAQAVPQPVAPLVLPTSSYPAPTLAAIPAPTLATYTSADPYDDAVADPEPYPGATPAALKAAGLPLPYSSASSPALPVVAPVAPVAAAAPRVASLPPYGDAADPEPYPGATPAALQAAGIALPYYASPAAAAYSLGDSADPEPTPAAQYSAPSGGQSAAAAAYVAAAASIAAAAPVAAVPVAAAPVAAPAAAVQYQLPAAAPSVAAPSYDSADPEPAAYYANPAAYLASNAIDADDAPADPEPDPASYSANPGAYPAYSPADTLDQYSADPEPAAYPEFSR